MFNFLRVLVKFRKVRYIQVLCAIYNMNFHDQAWKDAEVGFCGTLEYICVISYVLDISVLLNCVFCVRLFLTPIISIEAALIFVSNSTWIAQNCERNKIKKLSVSFKVYDS